MVRVGDPDQGSQVEDGRAVVHRRPDAIRVADIAAEDLESLGHVIVAVVQPATAPEGVVLDEGSDLVSAPNQHLHQV